MQAALYGCGQVICVHREKATGMNGGGEGVWKLSSVHCCEKLSVNIFLKADKQSHGKGALGC